ncbi:peptidylprolyl isomerase [Planktotalea frisia]|jgi:peptidylprolyl isomerase|uniref:Peptidyl-prolyl cis-trans isomerase n=1 Tax=Planktotalea frisia TaxID=696762 RepID=A0A1L9NRG4_9RHOB|nr:peptidylprolyl isomerase [Planktotalea frisia]OJI91813.1 peptidyl-prolyl cis-trans isomerase B [Planktotalea frisia]PZX21713.1 peptidylprolyl isomerase [Planktotalea frisia]
MRKLALAFTLLASPALATGLQIEIAGEGANGTVTIDLLEDLAPKHVAQITSIAQSGAYDGVVFHRVIDGFMAQTGDVQFGQSSGNTSRAGMGGSDMPDIQAEFSSEPFKRGIVGMARSQNPNSANSQFFIMFDDGDFLNGQYTVVGRVTAGMDVVDTIKLGTGGNGSVVGTPDMMKTVTVTE